MAGRLLDAGADPDAALILGETGLMTAARSGNPEVVLQLLAEGADPNAKAARAQTALMWAASQGHSEAVGVLLDNDADTHARFGHVDRARKTDPAQESHPAHQVWIQQGGNTALMFAARAGDVVSTELLLAAGADVNVEAAYGISATTLAAHSNHAAVVELLLESGARPDANRAGYTALHAAILRGNERTVRALLAHGADPNAPLLAPSPVRRQSLVFFFHRVFVGATPFWLAARFVQPGIMKALAEFGADPLFSHYVGYWVGLRPSWTGRMRAKRRRLWLRWEWGVGSTVASRHRVTLNTKHGRSRQSGLPWTRAWISTRETRKAQRCSRPLRLEGTARWSSSSKRRARPHSKGSSTWRAARRHCCLPARRPYRVAADRSRGADRRRPHDTPDQSACHPIRKASRVAYSPPRLVGIRTPPILPVKLGVRCPLGCDSPHSTSPRPSRLVRAGRRRPALSRIRSKPQRRRPWLAGMTGAGGAPSNG